MPKKQKKKAKNGKNIDTPPDFVGNLWGKMKLDMLVYGTALIKVYYNNEGSVQIKRVHPTTPFKEIP
jgi:hypothetical protein